MNDEARMRNDEITTMKRKPRVKGGRCAQFFGLRHSSFVIFLLPLIFALAACNSSKTLTKANVDEVAEGMSRKQVESILGPPTATTLETKEKKATYVYTQGKESVTVVFKDDKVQSKNSTLSE
jgi:outer membrane protein assembly factor BamE (lipoprotein component of BamABCDE complex)